LIEALAAIAMMTVCGASAFERVISSAGLQPGNSSDTSAMKGGSLSSAAAAASAQPASAHE
jgi:hypothetical protein